MEDDFPLQRDTLYGDYRDHLHSWTHKKNPLQHASCILNSDRFRDYFWERKAWEKCRENNRKSKYVVIFFSKFFIYRIISSLIPRIASRYPSNPLHRTNYSSFFFYSFDHIVTTTRDMFAIGYMIERTCPEWMIWWEDFLIESNTWDESFLWEIHENILPVLYNFDWSRLNRFYESLDFISRNIVS